ncbi:RIP metalloprotease RseP [Xanthomonas albilineans]|uniref:Zinc metalloprotease n=1 Tax=Xanthomonas albilineans (strain GPE PC73 / CFBP 7063) TaxID=380358 RepID=D2U8W2_XANAP|nr:RIP metalloprotease RseP [Xanthomonas albilineans]QHQ28757.1 putative membrane-associated zinc metalloprotease protein [Xanthomonas albilineans]CBA16517.1 putative membrane-associated zinc metalloprotease protein [Xanthomonas albilineans GPE PC73]
MGNFFGSVWWMLVSLGVLVTFHEFGHFWVARRCGVKVLRFSVGFGKPLWSRHDRHGTEFAIAAIPLGGYVKMLDEREGEVAPAEQALAFNNKSVWQRIAIVAAGPIANLLLCVALLWAMFVIGKQDYAPIVGRADGLALQAGFQPGERIVRIGERDVSSWSEASMQLTIAAMDHKDVRVETEDPQHGASRVHILALSQLPAGFDEQQVPNLAGLTWRFTLQPAVIATVVPGSAADGVLRPGDRVLAVDGTTIISAEQVVPQVQALGRNGGSGLIEVERNGERMALQVHLKPVAQSGVPTWKLGIAIGQQPRPAFDATLRYGPLQAIPAALRETARMAGDTLGLLRRMLTGEASLRNVSGPISIAKAANISAQQGPDWFLNFLALLSLSLAIMNLLPIPILDGGHLLYYLIELVKGSPLSERAMAAGQFVGLALLAGLMGLAFYNDLFGQVMR